MRVDLSSLVEKGEGAFLLFQKRTGVIYTWDMGGEEHREGTLEGYAVPVADGVVRELLPQIHIGCKGALLDREMDQLDSIFRVAGVPFSVDRDMFVSTENAVWVRFPSWAEQVPIPGSRLAKWRPYWAKGALFVWWNCENERERQERLNEEAKAAEDETEVDEYLNEMAGAYGLPG